MERCRDDMCYKDFYIFSLFFLAQIENLVLQRFWLHANIILSNVGSVGSILREHNWAYKIITLDFHNFLYLCELQFLAN